MRYESHALLVEFVGQDLADVDRRRVHRIDQQRDALGEGFAVLLALLLAGLLDVGLERRGGLAEREHLLGQAVGRGARRIRPRARRQSRRRASRSSMLSRITRSSAARGFLRELAGGFRDRRLDRFARPLGGMSGGFLDLDQRSDQRRAVSALRFAASRSTCASIEASSASFDCAPPTPSSTLASSAEKRSCCWAIAAPVAEAFAGLDRRIA